MRRFNALGELPPDFTEVERATNLPPLAGRKAPVRPGVMRELTDNQSSWAAISFQATTTPQKIQDFQYRKFFLLQNRSGVGTIYFGIGYVPTAENGLVLPAGVSYEPYTYPVNEIWVMSDGPTVSGLLIYGV